MSDERPIHLTTQGPPSAVLPQADAEARHMLRQALATDAEHRRDAVAAVAVRWPRYIDAWAHLGDLGRDDIERYAAYRVGYHRGLDALRANGWRGSGYVRWVHPENRGFLRALDGLRAASQEIGETDEEERCALFLMQLDPDWPPTDR